MKHVYLVYSIHALDKRVCSISILQVCFKITVVVVAQRPCAPCGLMVLLPWALNWTCQALPPLMDCVE